MKIYTKTGDKGTTALFGGARIPKHHLRIECYGTIDELNSFTGLLRDEAGKHSATEELLRIQDRLFVIGSLLAAQPGKKNLKLPHLKDEDVLFLENAIDKMDRSLTPLRYFILPGGNKVASHAHICRCVCRRAERLAVLLSETEEVDALVVPYLNRLSDYFFTLARKLTHDLGGEETPWIPEKE